MPCPRNFPPRSGLPRASVHRSIGHPQSQGWPWTVRREEAHRYCNHQDLHRDGGRTTAYHHNFKDVDQSHPPLRLLACTLMLYHCLRCRCQPDADKCHHEAFNSPPGSSPHASSGSSSTNGWTSVCASKSQRLPPLPCPGPLGHFPVLLPLLVSPLAFVALAHDHRFSQSGGRETRKRNNYHSCLDVPDTVVASIPFSPPRVQKSGCSSTFDPTNIFITATLADQLPI